MNSPSGAKSFEVFKDFESHFNQAYADRNSIAHYNTPDEISRLITQLDAAIDAAIDTMPSLA